MFPQYIYNLISFCTDFLKRDQMHYVILNIISFALIVFILLLIAKPSF